jgi:hypothetical protein
VPEAEVVVCPLQPVEAGRERNRSQPELKKNKSMHYTGEEKDGKHE